MKEVSKPSGRIGGEVDDRRDTLDEDAREMLNESTRKFLAFVQQEKDRIRKQSLAESERIIAEAEQKARQTQEKAIRDARHESDAILAKSKELANLLVRETEGFSSALTDLRNKVETEIEEIEEKVQRQADAIAEVIRKGEKAIGEAREKLKNEFEASSKAVNELQRKLEQTIEKAAGQVEKHTEHPAEPLERTTTSKNGKEKSPQPGTTRTADYASIVIGDKPVVGTLYLDVYKGSPTLVKRFQESLSKLPNLEVSLVDTSARDKTRITVFLNQPLHILNILNQMSLVKSVVADTQGIRVVLQESDHWVG